MGHFDLCRACYLDLPNNANGCERCGLSMKISDKGPFICNNCLTTPPYFDQARIPYLYQQAIPFIVTQLKYHQHVYHARLIALLMLQSLMTQHNNLPNLLIPIPLHPKRYRERGFNQALEIARHLSKALDIELAYSQCIRSRDTPHQTRLDAKQRIQNLQNAFTVQPALNVESVAIIDDVLTTGSTANSLAKALKDHGVLRVEIWAFARA